MARVFIYGSCVSRDTLELSLDHEVVEYIARQSLISSSSPPTDLLDGLALNSGFQNRSLNGDLKSNLFPSIAKKASQIDLFVMDLTDERLGSFALTDGTFITHSVELQKSGRLGELPTTPTRLNIGSDRHFARWTRAAAQLKATLTRHGLFQRSILLRTPWATMTIGGKNVESFRNIATSEMNVRFNRYYEKLEELGFNTVTLPTSLALSDENHKWGAAPFHYHNEAYVYLLGAINANFEKLHAAPSDAV